MYGCLVVDTFFDFSNPLKWVSVCEVENGVDSLIPIRKQFFGHYPFWLLAEFWTDPIATIFFGFLRAAIFIRELCIKREKEKR